jgi:ABC-type multidrug transport system fused ATPase/permease subunit
MIFSLSWAFVFGYAAYLVYCDQFRHPVANGFTVGDLMVFLTCLGSLWDPLYK